MTNLKIKTLIPGDEAALEAFLLPRLARSMFLIGNMRQAGLVYNGERYTGTYCAAYKGENIVGVSAHFWNNNLIFQAPTHLDALWRATLRASGRPLAGLMGPATQVGEVKAALHLGVDIIQMDQKEKLYTLNLDDLVVPEALRNGVVQGRKIATRDLDVVTEWHAAYRVEAIGNEDSADLRVSSHNAMEHAIDAGNTWILEVQGRPVAMTAFNTHMAEAVQIGGVYTPPSERSQGYARCAVAQSLRDARAAGVSQAILFTGAENYAAQKAYTALGFQHSGDYRLLVLREAVGVNF